MVIRLFNHRNRQPGHRNHRPRTAFVLGGGGNLGAIQVGQLRALIERGIVPDVIVGCSVGALNGAAVAGHPTLQEVERLAHLWTGLTRNHIFPSSRLSRGPWLFLRNGLSAFPNVGLRRVIERWLRYGTFEETSVPLWVVATSVGTGFEHWFNSGDVTQALLASTALPGIFPPVDIAGERYVDGGVVNNVPVSKAIELGANRIYVLDVGTIERNQPDPRRPYEMLLKAVGIAHTYRFRVDIGHVPQGIQMFRLPGVDPGKLRYDDFSRSSELIDRAHRAAGAYLEHPTVEVQTRLASHAK